VKKTFKRRVVFTGKGVRIKKGQVCWDEQSGEEQTDFFKGKNKEGRIR